MAAAEFGEWILSIYPGCAEVHGPDLEASRGIYWSRRYAKTIVAMDH